MNNLATRMIDLAGQEGNDGEEYDLLQEGGLLIKKLEEKIDAVCDREYRSGFMAGWNAGVTQDEKGLAEASVRHKA